LNIEPPGAKVQGSINDVVNQNPNDAKFNNLMKYQIQNQIKKDLGINIGRILKKNELSK
jgi:hypothetical protein